MYPNLYSSQTAELFKTDLPKPVSNLDKGPFMLSGSAKGNRYAQHGIVVSDIGNHCACIVSQHQESLPLCSRNRSIPIKVAINMNME